MNRDEALRLLGLDEGATAEDVKTAYKETAMILHPDKFSGNRKLQKRAEEQFKNLQEAYDVLQKPGSSSGRSRSATTSRARTYNTREAELQAKLSGIAAARVQLQKQRDSCIDRRRTDIMMLIGGAFVAIIARWRIPALAGLAGAVAFWGGFNAFTTHQAIKNLSKQIARINTERRAIMAELEELEG